MCMSARACVHEGVLRSSHEGQRTTLQSCSGRFSPATLWDVGTALRSPTLGTRALLAEPYSAHCWHDFTEFLEPLEDGNLFSESK